jgi:signal transduction histidine kinase
MTQRRRFGGIRLRLALAISLTTLVAVVASFIALERGTEADLRNKIDSELTAQNDQFNEEVAAAGVKTPAQLSPVVRRFVAKQRYRPASRILLITVKGYPTVTNQQRVLDTELERERGTGEGAPGTDDSGGGSSPGGSPVVPQQGGSSDPGESESGGGGGSGGDGGSSGDGESGDDGGEESGMLPFPIEIEGTAYAQGGPTLVTSRKGFSTIQTEEAGDVRVLTSPVRGVNGARLGTFRAADPLASVELTRSGLRNTFLLVGIAALLMATAVAISLANFITRPLRRMARFASAVDAGDLTHRLGHTGGGEEVDVLADSFDGMLDRLEQAFTRQQDFVSDASHELRTPLTVLRGQIDLLRRTGDDPEERRRITETVLVEIDRMNRLVDDMLTLARAEQGDLLQRRPVELEDFFEDLDRDLPLLGKRHYDVSDAPPGSIDADPDRLRQVFRNLVRNAVSHTGAESHISVGAVASNGRVRFSVADDGPGIPADQIDRVFDRFHRTDQSRARDTGGSGLGLAIARAIVEAHGGRIWVESAPGVGATFRFELPGYRGGGAGYA